MIELLTVRASAALTAEDARIWLRAGARSLEHSGAPLVIALQMLRWVDRADAAKMHYALASRAADGLTIDESKKETLRRDRLRDRSIRAGFDCEAVPLGSAVR